MQLAVLVNPRARGVRRDPGLAARLAAVVGARGEVITTSPERLPEVCRTLCARGAALVALCGGDGTGQATITELLRAYRAGGRAAPSLALLRGGTVNTVARNLGIIGDPARILASITLALDRGLALPRITQPILSVNGRHGFLFAAALGARFLELYYEAAEPGPARAAYLAARVSSSALVGGALATRLFRPAGVAITVDEDEPVYLSARLLVASTVVDVGVGMRICPRATALPDRFQLIASGLAPSEMARQLPAVLAGRALVGTPHLDRLAARALLQFDSDEPYTLDGELFRAREITIALDAPLSIVRAPT